MDGGGGDGGRLFFAAVPDPDTAAKIHRLATVLKRAHRFGGDLIARERLHISLLFLGCWSGQVVRRVSEAVAEVRMPSFEVAFDRSVSFRGRPGHRPFVLVGDDAQVPLKSLRHRLGGAIAGSGMGRLARGDFTPHVTLLYGEREVEEYPILPIRWKVHEFVLIHSLRGHAHLARWRFDV